MSLDGVGMVDARGSRKAKDYLLCGDEPRLPVDKCRDARPSCRARLTHRHQILEPENGGKTMLCSIISLELLPSRLSHWRHSEGPNPVVDEPSVGR